MIIVAYILACIAFYLAFIKLGLVARTFELMSDFRSAAGVIGNPELSDLEKEERTRKAATKAMGQTLALVARLVAVLAAAALPVALAVTVGINLDAFIAFSLNPIVLIVTAIAVFVIERFRRVRAS